MSYPVFLDRRTLIYLATADDGSGPWLHALDVERRESQRALPGIERYTSLATSADGRRLLMTTTRRKSSLWRASIEEGADPLSEARRVPLSASGGRSPRIGAEMLMFVASKGAQDAIWKLTDGIATEVWTAAGTRLVGAPAISADGRRVAFAVQREANAVLHVMSIDGMGAHPIAESLHVTGSPAWSPDGQSRAVAALEDGVPRLFSVPLEGGQPHRLVDDHAVDPSWSPDGRFIVFSGAEVGPRFTVKAVTADGQPWPLPPVTLSRGARRLRVLEGGTALVALRGEMGRGDLVLIDLRSGAERPLIRFGDDFVIRDFDISADGRELVVDRYVDDTDLVLIDR